VRSTTLRGSHVGLAIDAVGWVALLGRAIGGPWALVPTFVLLGLTGAIVGVAALFMERDVAAACAFVIGLAAPLAMWYWLDSRPGDAL
jgi:hypothetical protein